MPPADQRSAYRLGIALGLVAPVLWSSSGVLVKVLPLEPLLLAALRALIAGLALAPFVRPRQIALTPALGVLLLAYTVSVSTFVPATRLTTAANVIALVCTAPAWVLLLTWAAERRVQWRRAAPVAIMLAGVAALLLEPQAVTGNSTLGNALGVLCGLGFGVFTFLVPRVRLGALALVSLSNLAAAALLAAFLSAVFLNAAFLNTVPAEPLAGTAPLTDTVAQPFARVAAITAPQWLALGFLGVVQIGVATACFAAALRRIPATQASMLALVEPVLNPVWVFLVVGEVPSGYGYAGLALILGGVLADTWARSRRTAAAT